MAEKHHHITRIDIEPSGSYPKRHPTHGWQVRVRRDGKRLSKFFADARYEGQNGALEAAIHYRDGLIAELPAPDARPRKAWSNTGVIGLSVRKKASGEDEAAPKTYVQLNWIDADGKRRGASYSVEKWGLRRALWNGCLRLHSEREAAGRPVDEAHVMFARAQEPFKEQINAEVAAEAAANGVQEATQEKPAVQAQPTRPLTHDDELRLEEKALEYVADTLFGKGNTQFGKG